jgi:Fe-S cluster biosynthesis and repair protein YggX
MKGENKMGKAKLKEKQIPYKIAKGVPNELNIFELGTLLHFETHSWQAKKRLPQDIAKKISKKAEGEWVRANKILINREHLQNINSIITAARNYVWDTSNPFPIKGINFLALEIAEASNVKLKEFSDQLKEAVVPFVAQYKQHIEEAKEELEKDGLFDKEDYPDSNEIGDRFWIYWRMFDMTVPSNASDAIYKEESKRIKDLFTQTRTETILALREGFGEIVTHLAETMNGKAKGKKMRVRPEAIEKVMKFFDTFQYKNVFKDGELDGLVKQAKELLIDVEPKDLRDDKSLAKLINNELGDIKSQLDDSIEIFKRKLTF